MRGNSKHEIWIEDDGAVGVSNDDDGHYYQVFETADELNKFIFELIDISQKAFGKKEEQ